MSNLNPVSTAAKVSSPFSLCVYCASRPGNNPIFMQAAQELGTWLGSIGGQLVYGGSSTGLMGTVATATLAAGGRVIGTLSQDLILIETPKEDCTELQTVSNLHERKALMAKLANAFFLMPGGIGSFDEFFDTWTWKHLGYYPHQPIGLLNINGYYDKLLDFLAHGQKEGLMTAEQMALLQVHTQTVPLAEQLRFLWQQSKEQAPALTTAVPTRA
jgi:uncharacterized protein (TIGR00730 family)